MELLEFKSELSSIFDNPGPVTRRQGAEFAARLHRFLHQGPPQLKTTLWTVMSDEEAATAHDGDLCPHARFMRTFLQVVTHGLDQMRQNLLSFLGTEDPGPIGCPWQTLTEHFLHPMSRLLAYSRAMQACLSPMRSWMDTGVLIGYRTLCLSDQIRQYCMDHFLKHTAPLVSVYVFRVLHRTEISWSTGDLEPVHKYVSILHQYQKFQIYLSNAGNVTGPFEDSDGISDESHGAELFNVTRMFVEPYLDCLMHLYRPLLQPFDAHMVAPRVGDWLCKEETLAKECNIAGFCDAVVSCLLQETVKTHLESYEDAVRDSMGRNNRQELSLLFRVMVIVDGGLDHLLLVLLDFVKDQMLRMFYSMRTEFESLDPNSAKATSMYIEGCVAQMRLCKEMIDSTELHASLNRNLLLGTVRTGIADVFNSNPLVDVIKHPVCYPAAALAHHFHRQLRAIRAPESDNKGDISNLMTLYSLLVDKEAFLVRYHSLLRERLLSEGCDHLSLDAENFALESFTEISGWKAVYEVKSVLKDFRESEEFNSELSDRPEYQSMQRDLFGGLIPMKFTFVRGIFWRMAAEIVKLPMQLEPIVNFAISAYQSHHSGRIVSFVYSYGSSLLAFTPSKIETGSDDGEEVMLRCSTAVMFLLLNFNEFDSLTAAALQERTGIRASDVRFYLHHLVRAGLLISGPDDDTIAVNESFKSSAKLVNLMVSQQQTSQKHRRRLEKLDQRMQEKRVQCVIVSIMKEVRHLDRNILYSLVQSRLPQSALQAGFFAEQLTYLTSGGYIRLTSDTSEGREESVVEYIP